MKLSYLWLGVAVTWAAGPAGAVEASGPPVEAGAAKVDITPEGPIRLSGYGARQAESEGVAQKLWARALAIGADDEGGGAAGAAGPVVIVTVDSIAVPGGIVEAAAERLAERAGIARERLVVASTHSHAAPQVNGFAPLIFYPPPSPEEQQRIDRYSEQLVDWIEEAALAALADRRPARLSWVQGEIGFAANRRVLDDDGRWTGFGVDPDGPSDHALPVLRVSEADGEGDGDGTLLAVLAGYACHCTTMGGDYNHVHGDWAGVASELLEERHEGAVALVSIGAGADQNPEPRGTVELAERHGESLAEAVEELLAGPMTPLPGPPAARLERIELPFDHPPGRGELERRVDEAEANPDDLWAQRVGDQARRYLAGLDRGEAVPATLEYPVQAWAFGDELAMVFLAGEVVVDYSLRLKRELDGERLWITAYANDVPCYIPSRRILAEGGYEVEQSMTYYDRPGRFAPAVEDRIVEAVHDLLPAAFRSR